MCRALGLRKLGAIMKRVRGLLFLVGIHVCLNSDPVRAADQWRVSVRGLPWGEYERIVGFHMTVRGGRVVRLTEVPTEWSVSISNESPEATADGAIMVGAAAPDKGDRRFFQEFVVVEAYPGECLQLTLVVHSTTDFDSWRDTKITSSGLDLRKLPGLAARKADRQEAREYWR